MTSWRFAFAVGVICAIVGLILSIIGIADNYVPLTGVGGFLLALGTVLALQARSERS